MKVQWIGQGSVTGFAPWNQHHLHPCASSTRLTGRMTNWWFSFLSTSMLKSGPWSDNKNSSGKSTSVNVRLMCSKGFDNRCGPPLLERTPSWTVNSRQSAQNKNWKVQVKFPKFTEWMHSHLSLCRNIPRLAKPVANSDCATAQWICCGQAEQKLINENIHCSTWLVTNEHFRSIWVRPPVIFLSNEGKSDACEAVWERRNFNILFFLNSDWNGLQNSPQLVSGQNK